jgi:two-component system sensor kinase FixL
MNWITITWPMVAAVCLALGLIELRVALDRPVDAARLLFSLSAFITAWQCGIELAVMQADTPAHFQSLIRLGKLAVGLMVTSLTAFIWVYFRSGNRWLALAAPGLFALALLFNYFPGSSLAYFGITGLRTIHTFGGATYHVAEGRLNPWNVLTYLSGFVLFLFVVDASRRLARRGGRRRTIIIGWSIAVWVLVAGVHSALVEAGVLRMPYILSVSYLVIVLAIASELAADVSAAAKVGRELQESERRMDLATAAAGLGMWTWNLHTQEGWASPKAQSLLGLESEHLTNASFMGAVHPDDREAVKLALSRSLSNDRDLEMEYRVQTASAAAQWISVRGRIERDSAGKPMLMRGVVLDISTRRRSELELQHLQSQLAHTSRVSMLGQLATALAHELHQPLGAILRNAEAAELFLGHDPIDFGEIRAILMDIRADDQRAREVIDRLRALLKRGTIDPRSLAVPDLLTKIASLTRAEALTRGITVEVDTRSELPSVIGDAVHVQQVLLNLVLNAMDAIEGADSAERLIVVRAQPHEGGQVEVLVSDTGPGIPEDKMAQIFEPFFTTKASGMGIGLSVSRTIIEAHGGRLWAESKADRGAIFRFTLPIEEMAVS